MRKKISLTYVTQAVDRKCYELSYNCWYKQVIPRTSFVPSYCSICKYSDSTVLACKPLKISAAGLWKLKKKSNMITPHI